jgi:hypothetical protein
MSETTTTPGFSEDQMHLLACVLDEIIPPSTDGRFPGAGQLGLARYIDEAMQKTPELRSMIAQGLTDLDNLARSRKTTDFAALSKADKLQLLNEQGFVLPLAFQTYIVYYQQARVVAALGLEARPPHPKGYEMAPNDLTLLDAVRRSPKRYRDC